MASGTTPIGLTGLPSAAQRTSENCILRLAAAKYRVQDCTGCCIRESIKRALLDDELRRAHESAPSRACQRAADTHTPHAQRGDLRHAQVGIESDQQVDGLRCD